jgi:hypothetical protein
MNLQFLSGNPIAKGNKKRKAKRVSKKKAGGPRMGSKKKSRIKKNPTTYYAGSGAKKAPLGKLISSGEAKALLTAGRRLSARAKSLKKEAHPKARLLGHKMAAAAKKAMLIKKSAGPGAKKLKKKINAANKSGIKTSFITDDQIEKVLSQAGVTPDMKKYLDRKEKKMAKKKKASKKKVAKKVSKKKVTKKAGKKASKKKAGKKVSKKRSVKKAHKRKASKKAHRKSKSRKSKSRSKSRKVKSSVRRKTYKFKKRITKAKIAKSRKSLSVYLKNPLKGVGQMAGKASQIFEQGTGLDLKEAGLLVGAGASIGTLESLVSKYGQAVITKLPVQLQSSAPALLVGVIGSIGHAVAVKKLGKNHIAVDAMKAIVAASIVRVASATLSSTINKALGMSGVDFTPMRGVPQLSRLSGIPKLSSMRGVDYTPMSGVDYTPMGNVNPGSMGFKSADFGSFDTSDFGGGGGYTEGRKTSKADFGGVDIDDLDALEDDSDNSSMG